MPANQSIFLQKKINQFMFAGRVERARWKPLPAWYRHPPRRSNPWRRLDAWQKPWTISPSQALSPILLFGGGMHAHTWPLLFYKYTHPHFAIVKNTPSEGNCWKYPAENDTWHFPPSPYGGKYHVSCSAGYFQQLPSDGVFLPIAKCGWVYL